MASPRLAFDVWPSGITSADVPANNNVQRLDATVNMSVKSATTTAQPGSPANGDVYILPAAPTGALWAGNPTGTIAYYNTTWYFFTPKRGMRALVEDSGADLKYTTVWTTANVAPADPVTALTSGTTVTVDCSLGKNFTITLGHNVGTLTLSNLAGAGYATEIEIEIKQDATGGRTLALPAAFKLIGGSDAGIASAANAVSIISGKTFDNGTTWRVAIQETA